MRITRICFKFTYYTDKMFEYKGDDVNLNDAIRKSIFQLEHQKINKKYDRIDIVEE